MLTELEKEQKREAKLKRDIAKFKANIAIPRPGTSGAILQTDIPVLEKHGIELSDILYLTLADLRDNPLNQYPPLSDEELEELTEDIREKGILIALIVKQDGTIVCGHNRKRAGIKAGLVRGPAQQILSALTPELERDIMKSENDRRRGGQWSKEQKEKFIQENFEAEIQTDNRGGDHGNQYTGGKSSVNLGQGETNLARKIEKQSRGRITSGTAKRIIADIRKKTPKKADSGTDRLSEKEKRRAEKLALNIRTWRETKAVFARKMEALDKLEKAALRELKMIGQPHLFGV
jgi:hypothetical protein